MSVRTNVSGSLDALEFNQAELLRKGLEVESRLAVLESFVAQQQVVLDRLLSGESGVFGELERLSADLDRALSDLDAIGAGP